jgi:hypothetical protein
LSGTSDWGGWGGGRSSGQRLHGGSWLLLLLSGIGGRRRLDVHILSRVVVVTTVLSFEIQVA